MTRRQKTFLGLTGGGVFVALLSWLIWFMPTMGASSSSMAAEPDSARQRVPIESPPVVRFESMFNDGKEREVNLADGLAVTYDVRPIQEGREAELTFFIRNDAKVVANAGFTFSPKPLRIEPLKHHRMEADVEVDASDQRSALALGFHVFGDPGGYLGEFVTDDGQALWKMPSQQHLVADFVAPGDNDYMGRRAGTLVPRVSIINIEPGATVKAKVRWRAAEVFDHARSLARVSPVAAPVTRARAAGVLRVKVAGVGLGKADADLEQVLVLRSATGADRVFTQAGRTWAHGAAVSDHWEVTLPPDIQRGRYTMLFGVRDKQGAQGQYVAMTPDAGAVRDKSGLIRVGQVDVSATPVGMQVGMSFHRYPGPSERRYGAIDMDYRFARSLAATGMSAMEWWKGDDDYDWTHIDEWAAFHGKDGHKLLMVFSGSPTWASARPREQSVMYVPGLAAPPAKKYWPAYGRMVTATLERLKGRLIGVECWNEPDLIGAFTGTQTELADLCKIVATKSRQLDPSVPVICPQAESPYGMSFVLGAKTSEGEPLPQFCDIVGAHVYGAMGDDAQGRPYDALRVEDVMAKMRTVMQSFGVDKPIAVTEYGIASCGMRPLNGHEAFTRMSSADAGEALYQSVKAFRLAEVSMLGLYSFDHDDKDPTCRPGGSFVRTTKLNAAGVQRLDREVLDRLGQAARDFGP
ncbi:MAG: hypothetical protein EPO09_19290 [Aquabacterium sp.]|uniref:hypothetical protein n=1 Tax=Aquabacterium sp. TaxID=1872578 RepID=UPI001218E6EA|nr:hypothetical protein [Aquabacterium sp.]TAK86773.1 MAG: hypothetical protein EPO09_19290 [Aquabacterium sp.]